MKQRLKKAKTRYVAAGKRHAHFAKRVVSKPLFSIPFTIAFVFTAIIAVGLSQRTKVTPVLKANNSNVVLLTYDKKQHIIPTDAKTVGEMLERTKIELHEGDIVEPSKNEEIIGDNFRINIYRAAPVTIVDNGRKTFAFSAATTARSIVNQTGITVYPEDKLSLSPVDDFLSGDSLGQRVIVERSVPVYINLYGTATTVRTHSKTVGQLLEEKGVKLGADDNVQPSLDAKLEPSTQVFLMRNGVQIQAIEEVIEHDVEKIEDNSLSFGTAAIRQQGSDGKKIVTYQIDTQNGSRSVIQEVIIQQPVTHIVARGKAVDVPSDKEALMRSAGIKQSDYAYVAYIINHENALWCSTRWQGQMFCPTHYLEKYPGAENNTKLGYGLCQSTPANKMATAGADWRTNPVTQLKWCSGYAIDRYGTWEAAYEFKAEKGWW